MHGEEKHKWLKQWISNIPLVDFCAIALINGISQFLLDIIITRNAQHGSDDILNLSG